MRVSSSPQPTGLTEGRRANAQVLARLGVTGPLTPMAQV